MGFLTFVIAFIIVFAIGLLIRSLINKARKKSQSGNVTITPQINIGSGNSPSMPAAPPVFCSNCGAKLDAGSAFCGNCGKKVG